MSLHLPNVVRRVRPDLFPIEDVEGPQSLDELAVESSKRHGHSTLIPTNVSTQEIVGERVAEL